METTGDQALNQIRQLETTVTAREEHVFLKTVSLSVALSSKNTTVSATLESAAIAQN